MVKLFTKKYYFEFYRIDPRSSSKAEKEKEFSTWGRLSSQDNRFDKIAPTCKFTIWLDVLIWMPSFGRSKSLSNMTSSCCSFILVRHIKIGKLQNQQVYWICSKMWDTWQKKISFLLHFIHPLQSLYCFFSGGMP
jgi:hypothetical protein